MDHLGDPRIGLLVHAGRTLDDLGCLPIRLVSAKQLRRLRHLGGLDRPEDPHAAQHFLPGLSCEPVLPEAKKIAARKFRGQISRESGLFLICVLIGFQEVLEKPNK